MVNRIIEVLKMPASIVFRKVVRRLQKNARDTIEEWWARVLGTEISDRRFLHLLGVKNKEESWIRIFRGNLSERSLFVDLPDRSYKALEEEHLAILNFAERTIQHKFELLGSGPVKVDYFGEALGVEGNQYKMAPGRRAKTEQLRKIVRRLPKSFCSNYDPIDWHTDFKSGYRWSENTWFGRIRHGFPGVDIKVPWELSRFQHGVRLGQAYRITGDERFAKEIICEIIDWIESNQKGYGPNWIISMEVAIRTCNWLVSLALISDSEHLTDEVLWIVAKSLFEHGDYIRKHLEGSEELTSNHYTSNIVGLHFLANLCPSLPNSSEWASFSASELEKEIVKQVYDDGCDFEASTCYHRLVLEMFFYSALLSQKVGKSFSASYLSRLETMFEALRLLLHENGEVPQFGDNDSGRFLIFESPNTSVLRMDYLLPIGDWFFGRKDRDYRHDVDDLPLYWLSSRRKKTNQSDGWNFRPSHHFANAGWAVLRKNRMQIVVCSGNNGQDGNGGHAHNDKLSFELSIRGVPIVVDPGTYLYTPNVEARNDFRSTRNHSTPQLENTEQNPIIPGRLGAFRLFDRARASISRFEYDFLEAVHYGFGSPIKMELKVEDKQLSCFYLVSKGTFTMRWQLHPAVSPRKCKKGIELNTDHLSLLLSSKKNDFEIKRYDYSPEYGVKVPGFAIAHTFEKEFSWGLEMIEK